MYTGLGTLGARARRDIPFRQRRAVRLVSTPNGNHGGRFVIPSGRVWCSGFVDCGGGRWRCDGGGLYHNLAVFSSGLIRAVGVIK